MKENTNFGYWLFSHAKQHNILIYSCFTVKHRARMTNLHRYRLYYRYKHNSSWFRKLLLQYLRIPNNLKQEDYSLEVASLMRSFLKIFPDAFFGIVETNATRRTFLYGATCYFINNVTKMSNCSCPNASVTVLTKYSSKYKKIIFLVYY